MSSKTFHPPPRRVPRVDINSSNSNTKRKERDEAFEKPKHPTKPSTIHPPPRRVPIVGINSSNSKTKPKERDEAFEKPKHLATPSTTIAPKSKINLLKPNNQLIAGYLAHEFLTKGTLLGQRWGHLPSKNDKVKSQEHKIKKYEEVARLLKTDGTHLKGVVNPTQLAGRFLKL